MLLWLPFPYFLLKDAAADIRLIRRMDRDCAERGRTVAQVIEQYNQTVRPMHLQYVEPSKLVADIIVHSTSDTSSKNETDDPDAKEKSQGSFDVACEVLKNHLMVVANLSFDNSQQQYSMEDAIKHMKNSANVSTSSS
jgi:CRISPR/Cas system CMR-associated protein Cmr5 small subunit